MLHRLAALVLMAGSFAFAGTIMIVTEDVNGPYIQFHGRSTAVDLSVLESFDGYPIFLGAVDESSIELLLVMGGSVKSPVIADIPISVNGDRSVFRLFVNIQAPWYAWMDFYDYSSAGVPLHFYNWYVPNRGGLAVAAYAVPEPRSGTFVLGAIVLLSALKGIMARVNKTSTSAGSLRTFRCSLPEWPSS